MFFLLLIKTVICNFKLNIEFFLNENIYDVLMNDIKIKDEPF